MEGSTGGSSVPRSWSATNASKSQFAPHSISQTLRRDRVNPVDSTGPEFHSVDFFGRLKTFTERELRSVWKPRTIWQRVLTQLSEEKLATRIFLALLGIVCALVALSMEFVVSRVNKVRKSLGEEDFPYNFILVLLLTLAFALLSPLCVHLISKASTGSGVPEMKSILGGIRMPQFLTFRTLLSKVLGLTFAFCAGLFAGKEGAYVHIGAGICAQLLRIPVFRDIKENDILNIQMLSIASAVGIAAVFGAPLGGVLFSIEVTSVYYEVSNFWKGVYSATAGAIVFYFTQALHRGDSFVNLFPTDFPSPSFQPFELFYFTLLGILMGLFGALFVKMVKTLVVFRKTWLPLKDSLYGVVIFVAFLTVILTFPFGFLKCKSIGEVMLDLLASGSMAEEWQSPSVIANLIIFLFIATVLVSLTVVLPIPVGLFAPTLLLGAIAGRLMGEIIASSTSLENGAQIYPGVYAIVGAAAMTSGVTRTLSTSLIAFEATGQINYLIPCVISTVLATAVGYIFNYSVFDMILRLNRLPLLTTFRRAAHAGLYARDVMIRHPHIDFLTMESTVYEMWKMLSSREKHKIYPIVVSRFNMTLVGTITRKDIETVLKHYETEASGPESGRKGQGVRFRWSSLRSVMPHFTLFKIPLTNLNSREDPSLGMGISVSESFDVEGDEIMIESDTKSEVSRMNGKEPHDGVDYVARSEDSVENMDGNGDEDEDEDEASKEVSVSGMGTDEDTKSHSSQGEEIPRKIEVEKFEFTKGLSHVDSPKKSKDRIEETARSPRRTSRMRRELGEWGSSMVAIKGKRLFEELPFFPNLSLSPPNADFADIQKRPYIELDSAPLALSERTPLSKVHFVFSMMVISHAFIVSSGKLVGIITKKDLIKRKI